MRRAQCGAVLHAEQMADDSPARAQPIGDALERLDLAYPKVDAAKLKALAAARKALAAEKK